MPSIERVLELLSAGWLGTLLAAVGLIYAYYLYRRSLQKPLLIYKISGITIIGRQFAIPSGLRIDYLGQQVDSLNRSWALIWNHGNKEITRANVSNIRPIRVCCQGGSLLEAKIVKMTTPANGALLMDIDSEGCRLDFEYFNPGDGVTVELLHSGDNSRIEVTGEFVGSQPIKKALTAQDLTGKPAQKKDLLPYESAIKHIGVFLVAGLILLFLLDITFDVLHTPTMWMFERMHGTTAAWLIGKAFLIFFWVMGLGFAFLVVWMWRHSGWRHPKALSITGKDM